MRACQTRLDSVLIKLRKRRCLIANTAAGAVEFELLPPFNPGLVAHVKSFGAACHLLTNAFKWGALIKDCIYRQTLSERSCLVAGVWLAGRLVSATVLRVNLPKHFDSTTGRGSDAIHVQIAYQATVPDLQRRGLGCLLACCVLHAAADAGHQYATVVLLQRGVIEEFWSMVGFGPHAASSSGSGGGCAAVAAAPAVTSSKDAATVRAVMKLSLQKEPKYPAWLARLSPPALEMQQKAGNCTAGGGGLLALGFQGFEAAARSIVLERLSNPAAAPSSPPSTRPRTAAARQPIPPSMQHGQQPDTRRTQASPNSTPSGEPSLRAGEQSVVPPSAATVTGALPSFDAATAVVVGSSTAGDVPASSFKREPLEGPVGCCGISRALPHRNGAHAEKSSLLADKPCRRFTSPILCSLDGAVPRKAPSTRSLLQLANCVPCVDRHTTRAAGADGCPTASATASDHQDGSDVDDALELEGDSDEWYPARRAAFTAARRSLTTKAATARICRAPCRKVGKDQQMEHLAPRCQSLPARLMGAAGVTHLPDQAWADASGPASKFIPSVQHSAKHAGDAGQRVHRLRVRRRHQVPAQAEPLVRPLDAALKTLERDGTVALVIGREAGQQTRVKEEEEQQGHGLVWSPGPVLLPVAPSQSVLGAIARPLGGGLAPGAGECPAAVKVLPGRTAPTELKPKECELPAVIGPRPKRCGWLWKPAPRCHAPALVATADGDPAAADTIIPRGNTVIAEQHQLQQRPQDQGQGHQQTQGKSMVVNTPATLLPQPATTQLPGMEAPQRRPSDGPLPEHPQVEQPYQSSEVQLQPELQHPRQLAPPCQLTAQPTPQTQSIGPCATCAREPIPPHRQDKPVLPTTFTTVWGAVMSGVHDRVAAVMDEANRQSTVAEKARAAAEAALMEATCSTCVSAAHTRRSKAEGGSGNSSVSCDVVVCCCGRDVTQQAMKDSALAALDVLRKTRGSQEQRAQGLVSNLLEVLEAAVVQQLLASCSSEEGKADSSTTVPIRQQSVQQMALLRQQQESQRQQLPPLQQRHPSLQQQLLQQQQESTQQQQQQSPKRQQEQPEVLCGLGHCIKETAPGTALMLRPSTDQPPPNLAITADDDAAGGDTMASRGGGAAAAAATVVTAAETASTTPGLLWSEEGRHNEDAATADHCQYVRFEAQIHLIMAARDDPKEPPPLEPRCSRTKQVQPAPVPSGACPDDGDGYGAGAMQLHTAEQGVGPWNGLGAADSANGTLPDDTAGPADVAISADGRNPDCLTLGHRSNSRASGGDAVAAEFDPGSGPGSASRTAWRQPENDPALPAVFSPMDSPTSVMTFLKRVADGPQALIGKLADGPGGGNSGGASEWILGVKAAGGDSSGSGSLGSSCDGRGSDGGGKERHGGGEGGRGGGVSYSGSEGGHGDGHSGGELVGLQRAGPSRRDTAAAAARHSAVPAKGVRHLALQRDSEKMLAGMAVASNGGEGAKHDVPRDDGHAQPLVGVAGANRQMSHRKRPPPKLGPQSRLKLRRRQQNQQQEQIMSYPQLMPPAAGGPFTPGTASSPMLIGQLPPSVFKCIGMNLPQWPQAGGPMLHPSHLALVQQHHHHHHQLLQVGNLPLGLQQLGLMQCPPPMGGHVGGGALLPLPPRQLQTFQMGPFGWG